MHFHAFGFKSENKESSTHPHLGNLFCFQGKINIPHFPEFPPTLNALLTENNQNSVKFRKNIRRFNSRLAMASHIVDETTILKGVPGAYKIKE